MLPYLIYLFPLQIVDYIQPSKKIFYLNATVISSFQDLLAKASANIASLIWTHELLPLDILLLALIDRDDDPYALRIVVIHVLLCLLSNSGLFLSGAY